MLQLLILTIGKPKPSWLKEALEEYEKRLSSDLSLSWILAKDEQQLLKQISLYPSFVALTEKGKTYSSIEWSFLIEKLFSLYHSRLVFVIGGDTGLPASVLAKASHLISLSPLTFTHQMVRLILLEQLYRSFQIQKKSPYHK